MNALNRHEAGAEEIRWFVRPADGDSTRLIVVLVAAILSAVAGYFLVNSVVMALAGFALVMGSTAEFWLGTSYRLREADASSRCGFSLTALAWSDVKRVIVVGSRVKLSPLVQSTRMDAFRGVTLRTTEANFEEIMAFIRRHVDDALSVESPLAE